MRNICVFFGVFYNTFKFTFVVLLYTFYIRLYMNASFSCPFDIIFSLKMWGKYTNIIIIIINQLKNT